MTWSATFNPRKRQYHACNKSTVRIVEVMSEQKRGWAGRQITVSDASEAEAAARWVVEHNGCVVVPPDLGDDLRYAVMHALFYITFPDRPIDAPGGLLRGYQLPGRMVQLATGPVRHAGGTEIAARAKRRERSPAGDEPVGTAFHRRPPREGRAPARPTQRKGVGEPLADVLSPALAEVAEQAFAERIEAETLADGKTSKSFTLEAPIVIGEDFKAMVSREFRRIVYTGTMGWRQQIVRPAREVALGIWLATLSG